MDKFTLPKEEAKIANDVAGMMIGRRNDSNYRILDVVREWVTRYAVCYPEDGGAITKKDFERKEGE